MARLILLILLLLPAPLLARETVSASSPEHLSVTIYRDPNGGQRPLDPNWLNGFAMISETRTVVLPAGPSTIRFEGVAEGMVAVTAIVTGLPGGTIEKNRNSALLSPAALVDGMLGNRVTISRTNPATGVAKPEQAIVRTRADGGLVLQTDAGFEAVRCAGLPEKLTFDHVPDGLSARPIFSIDTNSPKGGTYRVTLTYLAAGFDWQANYLATLGPGASPDKRKLRLLAWLTLANDNGQSFPDAALMAVAGRINIESNFRALADPPQAKPLRLTCYPLGSTARVTLPEPQAYPVFQRETDEENSKDIVVTGSARRDLFASLPSVAAPAMKAGEEALGDLKLYRVPEPVTVAAQSLKQIAFLDQPRVNGTLFHRGTCNPGSGGEDEQQPLILALRTRNDAAHGLGLALPSGRMAVFEPSSAGEQLLGEQYIRDYASGQEVELPLTISSTAYVACGQNPPDDDVWDGEWHDKHALVSNANGHAVVVELVLADISEWSVRKLSGGHMTKDGRHILTARLPANSSRTLHWQVRNTEKANEARD